jgi:hypothetical protein
MNASWRDRRECIENDTHVSHGLAQEEHNHQQKTADGLAK